MGNSDDQEVVEVWLGRLDCSEEAILRLGGFLNDEEWRRARRYRSEEDRRAFTAGRGMVRELLGRRLGLKAGEVVIAYGEWGKPWTEGVEFSVAHAGGAGGWLALALGRVPVGVDIEKVRRGLDLVGMARAAFGTDAAEEIVRATDAEREELFFEKWVAREALGKLSGKGFQEASHSGGSIYRLGVGEGWKAALASAKPVRVVMRAFDSP